MGKEMFQRCGEQMDRRTTWFASLLNYCSSGGCTELKQTDVATFSRWYNPDNDVGLLRWALTAPLWTRPTSLPLSLTVYALLSFCVTSRWMKPHWSKSPRRSSASVRCLVMTLMCIHLVYTCSNPIMFWNWCSMQSSMRFPGGTSSKPTMWLTWRAGWKLWTRPARSLWVWRAPVGAYRRKWLM